MVSIIVLLPKNQRLIKSVHEDGCIINEQHVETVVDVSGVITNDEVDYKTLDVLNSVNTNVQNSFGTMNDLFYEETANVNSNVWCMNKVEVDCKGNECSKVTLINEMCNSATENALVDTKTFIDLFKATFTEALIEDIQNMDYNSSDKCTYRPEDVNMHSNDNYDMIASGVLLDGRRMRQFKSVYSVLDGMDLFEQVGINSLVDKVYFLMCSKLGGTLAFLSGIYIRLGFGWCIILLICLEVWVSLCPVGIKCLKVNGKFRFQVFIMSRVFLIGWNLQCIASLDT